MILVNMRGPTNLKDFLRQAEAGWTELWSVIDGQSPEEQEKPFPEGVATLGKEKHWARDRNLRDVLVHLYAWHRLLLDWVEAGRGGVARPFLPAPYNWRTYPEMNRVIWEQNQATSLSEAKTNLRQSHAEVMLLLGGLTEEELFSQGFFPWVGKTALSDYCYASTTAHYRWAVMKLRRVGRLVR